MDEVLIDLTMYEYRPLVAAALQLLVTQHSQRRCLLDTLNSVQLVVENELTDLFFDVSAKMSEILDLAERHELWGRLQTEKDRANNDRMHALIASLTGLCDNTTEDVGGVQFARENVQRLLRNAGVVPCIMRVFEIPYEHDKAGDDGDEEHKNLNELFRRCADFLRIWVEGSRSNQMALFQHLEFLVSCVDKDFGVAAVLAGIFRNNTQIAHSMDRKMILYLSSEISHDRPDPALLSCFRSILAPHGEPIKDNQTTIIGVLLAPARRETTVRLIGKDGCPKGSDVFDRRKALMEKETAGTATDADRRLLAYHAELLHTLGLCCMGKSNIAEAKCQQLYPFENLIDAVVDPRTTLAVKAALVQYLTLAFLEAETQVLSLPSHPKIWELLRHLADSVNAADWSTGAGVVAQIFCRGKSAKDAKRMSAMGERMAESLKERKAAAGAADSKTPAPGKSEANEVALKGFIFDSALPAIHAFFTSSYVLLQQGGGAMGVRDEDQDTIKALSKALAEAYTALDATITRLGGGRSAGEAKDGAGGASGFTRPTEWFQALQATMKALPTNTQQALSIVNAAANEGGSGGIARTTSIHEDDSPKKRISHASHHKTLSRVSSGPPRWERENFNIFVKELTQHPQVVKAIEDEFGNLVREFTNEGKSAINRDRGGKGEVIYDEDARLEIATVAATGLDVRGNKLPRQRMPLSFFTVAKYVLIDHLRATMASTEASAVSTNIALAKILRRVIRNEGTQDGKETTSKRHMQSLLTDLGLVSLLVDGFARIVGTTSGTDPHDELLNEILLVGLELFERDGGNIKSQKAAHDHFVRMESNDFFWKVNVQLSIATKLLHKARGKPADDVTKMEGGFHMQAAQKTQQLVTTLCRGHYKPMQELILDQSAITQGGKTTIVLKHLVAFLDVLSKSIETSQRAKMVTLSFNTLTEAIQGPCVTGQLALEKTKILEIANRMMSVKLAHGTADAAISETIENELKHAVVIALNAMLEGQTAEDRTIISAMARNLSTNFLIKRLLDLDKLINDFETDADEEELRREGQEIVMLLLSLNELRPDLPDLHAIAEVTGDTFVDATENIEITWMGAVHRIYFPLPPLERFLSDKLMNDTLNCIDRSTPQNKLKSFTEEFIDCYDVMGHGQWLERVGLAAIFSNRKLEVAMNARFFLVVALNVLLVIFYERPGDQPCATADDACTVDAQEPHLRWCPEGWTCPTFSFVGKKEKTFAEFVIWALGVLVIAFSTFAVALHTVAKAPTALKARRRDAERVHWAKLGGPYVSVALKTLFILIDWKLFYFVIYLLFAFFAMLKHHKWYPPLLLDIILRDPTTLNVVRAVTYPFRSLLSALVLTGIVIYIYGFFLFSYYSGDVGEMDTCRNLAMCVFDTGRRGMLMGGGLGEYLHEVDPGDDLNYVEDWYIRGFIDWSFFIVILVVLLNIVFGIIIDTFSELRAKKVERENDIANVCLICANERSVFDRLGNGWGMHTTEEHQPRAYLLFYVHLREKPKNDYTGAEAYVWDQLERKNISWFPLHKALSLKAAILDDDDAILEEVKDLQKSVKSLSGNSNNALEAVKGDLAELMQSVQQLALRVDDVSATLGAMTRQGGAAAAAAE